MKTAKVKIVGTSPMLMHRYPQEDQKAEAGRKDRKFDPKEDAEKALYQDEKGVYVPSVWIESAMREAAKEFKKGKSTYKAAIQSSVLIKDEKIHLGRKDYDEIDRRPVMVQRNRVVRSRPRFDKWSVGFEVQFNENRVPAEVLKQVLIEAGEAKGIGDYRPRFGRFSVTEFSVE